MSRRPLKSALKFAPSIAMLALAGGIIIHSFGGELEEAINCTQEEKELDDINTEQEFVMPVFDDITVIPEKEESEEELPDEEEYEEEDPITIESPHISDELLTSGYEFQDINFDELIEKNSDVDAWIEIQGTKIDYPVMHTPEKDNPEIGDYYYLHHDMNGNETTSGEIFLFSGNRSLNNNQEDLSTISLIYGHHMRYGRMFAQIFNYTNQSFYDEHPFGVIYTPDGYAFKVSFFAGVVTGPKTSESIDVSTEELFNEYVANAINNSTFQSDVEVNYGDKIVVLNTCEYTAGNNSKYQLYGVVEKQYTNELQISNNDEIEIHRSR